MLRYGFIWGRFPHCTINLQLRNQAPCPYISFTTGLHEKPAGSKAAPRQLRSMQSLTYGRLWPADPLVSCTFL